jgi:multiple sugar transport system permease protein
VFGISPIDFINGPYAAKMFVLCFYTVWAVMPFKILVLTGALASVREDYYHAARLDGTSPFRIFRKIIVTLLR